MIDLEKAKKEFEEYVSKYDMEKIKIKRKVSHSLRVMEISNQIAQSQNLTEEGVELATLIGLLHDIARFEQYTQYGTFSDADSVDHGDMSMQILQKNNYIRKYIETSDYDNIILKAIKNHNKFEADPNLTMEEELFTKIIRDADKIDILFQAAEMFWQDAKKMVENSKITPYVEEDIINGNIIKRRKGFGKNQLDKMVSMLSFVYDLNFAESFHILKEKDYINKIVDQFNFTNEETSKKVENIRKIVNEFIEINQ